jgi:hypothetical protein
MKTYSPGDVSTIIDGNIMTGFADGSMVKGARDEDAFSYTPSTSGGGTRTKSSSRAGKVTLTLQQSSESNKVLSALIKKDEDSSDAIVPILIRDNSGFTVIKAESAYLVKWPDFELSKELADHEYVFQCENLDIFLGGN